MPQKKSTCNQSVCPLVGGLKSEKDTFSTFYLHDGTYFGRLEMFRLFSEALVLWVFLPLVGMTALFSTTSSDKWSCEQKGSHDCTVSGS